MTLSPDRGGRARVTADGAQVEAPLGEAVGTILAEGEQVEAVEPVAAPGGGWAVADYNDRDYDHPDTRPRMRGWLHLFAAMGSVVAGAVLIPLAWTHGPRAGIPVSLYCLTILGLFGISAAYHRRRWSPRGWRVMKRLDHSMIFVFIAGTYTPFAMLAVSAPTNVWILSVVWAGALAGMSLKLVWPTAPRWVGVPIYIALGWVAVFVLTDILDLVGVTAMVLLAVGGVLYTAGGVAYGLKKPNPWPGTFGYHEVFHAATIVAATCHYIAVYFALYNSPFV